MRFYYIYKYRDFILILFGMANTLSQDLDFDIFNGVWDSEETFETADAPAEELESSAPEEVTDEEVSEDEITPADGSEGSEVMEDVPETESTDEDIDIDQLVADILWNASDIDEKVEDIKDEAQSSGNEELLGMIDELQTLLAEKNQKIDELTKKDEITSGRLMDTYWDAENYSFYKPTIEKLENNPQLMMLVKNFDSDNEKAQERVVSILADLISEKTGEDVSSLINSNQKNNVSNALTNVDWWWEVGNPAAPEEEKDFDYNESLNELF